VRPAPSAERSRRRPSIRFPCIVFPGLGAAIGSGQLSFVAMSSDASPGLRSACHSAWSSVAVKAPGMWMVFGAWILTRLPGLSVDRGRSAADAGDGRKQEQNEGGTAAIHGKPPSQEVRLPNVAAPRRSLRTPCGSFATVTPRSAGVLHRPVVRRRHRSHCPARA
jgi:hypothetical protein